VILEISTELSGITHPVMMAKPHFSEEIQQRYRAVPGEGIRFDKVIEHGIGKHNFPQLSTTLREIGVPPLQILTIEANGAYHFVELTGDENFLHFQ